MTGPEIDNVAEKPMGCGGILIKQSASHFPHSIYSSLYPIVRTRHLPNNILNPYRNQDFENQDPLRISRNPYATVSRPLSDPRPLCFPRCQEYHHHVVRRHAGK